MVKVHEKSVLGVIAAYESDLERSAELFSCQWQFICLGAFSLGYRRSTVPLQQKRSIAPHLCHCGHLP